MEIKGIITAMVTPFHQDGTINREATKQLVNKLIEQGVSGIFILGTNGEFHMMSDEEKVEYAKLVVELVNHRVPVYAGAGTCGTELSIRLGNKMKEVGVDALSIISPYFQKLSDQEMIEHYRLIAKHVDLPILLYNIPGLTQNPISVDVVKAVCDIENIKGIKDSGGNIEIMKSYIDATKGKDFVVLSGSDSLILKALEMGATGAIAATSNLLTEIDVAIYQNFVVGKKEEALVAQNSIEKLRSVLKLGVQPSVIKRSLVLTGIDVGEARKPIASLSKEADQTIKEMLEYYHFI